MATEYDQIVELSIRLHELPEMVGHIPHEAEGLIDELLKLPRAKDVAIDYLRRLSA